MDFLPIPLASGPISLSSWFNQPIRHCQVVLWASNNTSKVEIIFRCHRCPPRWSPLANTVSLNSIAIHPPVQARNFESHLWLLPPLHLTSNWSQGLVNMDSKLFLNPSYVPSIVVPITVLDNEGSQHLSLGLLYLPPNWSPYFSYFPRSHLSILPINVLKPIIDHITSCWKLFNSCLLSTE